MRSAAVPHPPRVGPTAPQTMLLLGALGMVLGLMVDSHSTQLQSLAGLCAAADRNLWSLVQLHWTLLPWTHAGMWVGGFMAIPLLRASRPTCRRQYCVRVAQNFACSAWMTVGMSAGVLLSEYLGAHGPASMLGGMFGGMVWGMAASVALYRLCSRMRQGRFEAPSARRTTSSRKAADSSQAACGTQGSTAFTPGSTTRSLA